MDFLEKLKEMKKPILAYDFITISDNAMLKQLVFTEHVLAPIGTFNDNYADGISQNEKEDADDEKKKKKKPQANLVNSALLQEQLQQRNLSFYVYYPTKKDIVEEYGAKYVEVKDQYYGFGLYSFVITSGTKIRKQDGDRRFLEINPEVPTLKEEIYIYFDDEADTFKRISKKGFDEQLEDNRIFKYSKEVTELIYSYKEFFNRTFLNITFEANVGGHFDPLQNFLDFASTFLTNSKKMEVYYLYYNVIGALNETEYRFIHKQIIDLHNAAYTLYKHLEEHFDGRLTLQMHEIKNIDKDFVRFYEHLINQYRKMKRNNWWYNVYTGEFHRNIMTFFTSYTTTDHFEDRQIEQLRKEATRLNKISLSYLNFSALDYQNQNNGTTDNGWHYEPLIDDNKPDALKSKINTHKKRIKENVSKEFVLQKYPKYKAFLSAIQDTND